MTTLRSTIFDGRLQPVTNLALNPKMVRASAGSTVARRNLALNPSFGTGDASNTQNIGSGNSQVLVSAQSKYYGSYGLRRTANIAGNALGHGWFTGTVQPGKYAVTMWVRPSHTRSMTIYSEGTATKTNQSPSSQPGAGRNLTANQWYEVRYFVNVTVAGTIKPGLLGNASEAGEWLDYGSCIIEAVPDFLPYFDGNTVNDLGFAYSWEGGAHASSSVAKASVTEVNRNLILNPRGVSSGTAWYSQPPTDVTLSVTADNSGPDSQNVGILTRTGGAATGALSYRLQPGNVSVNVLGTAVASQIIYGQLKVWAGPEIVGKSLTIEHPVRDTAAAISYQNTFASPLLVSGWNTISYSLTLTPRQTMTNIKEMLSPQIVINNVTAASGAVIMKVTDWVYSFNPITGFFDGNTTNDASLTPSWTGTAYASASVVSGISPHLAIREPQGLVHLTPKGLRLSGDWYTPGSDTAVKVAGDRNALTGLGITFVPGKTYTVVATLELTAAQTGSLNANARSIKIEANSSSTYAIIASSPVATNAPGVYILRVTFTVPLNAVWLRVRLFNGAPVGGGDVYWRDLTIVEGAYGGPSVNGDQAGAIWRGVPNNSQSVGYPPSVA